MQVLTQTTRVIDGTGDDFFVEKRVVMKHINKSRCMKVACRDAYISLSMIKQCNCKEECDEHVPPTCVTSRFLPLAESRAFHS